MRALLGKLERVSLRKVWSHEAGEFTPRLAQATLRMSAVFRAMAKELN